MCVFSMLRICTATAVTFVCEIDVSVYACALRLCIFGIFNLMAAFDNVVVSVNLKYHALIRMYESIQCGTRHIQVVQHDQPIHSNYTHHICQSLCMCKIVYYTTGFDITVIPTDAQRRSNSMQHKSLWQCSVFNECKCKVFRIFHLSLWILLRILEQSNENFTR